MKTLSTDHFKEFQAYGYRILVDVEATRKHYGKYLPLSSHCPCENCATFETHYALRETPFLNLLRQLGADPGRRGDKFYFYCLDGSEALPFHILGQHQVVGQLVYEDNRYYPISQEGLRETDPIRESLEEGKMELLFRQEKENLLTIQYILDLPAIS